ncbi:UPF0575 protein C19orf67 homolog isoform X1 [Misgurnus anguillicaudatus]|uniref:UPF0575 protein C19orf67 homolog isoform X1 n=1 Tax=Misgurnus anguillicaudatus TaxID=75329 RepID=UPI003CCFA45B
MMASIEDDELSSSCNEDEETKPLTEVMTGQITLEEDSAVAPSFGDARCCLVEDAANGSTYLEQRVMDEKIAPIEQQLQYLLNKADELQAELVWSLDGFQNDGLAHIITMFLQTCQPYFTYLESTARNSHPLHPPLSIYIRTQLLQFSQQLCSRLEQLVLMYASFNIVSVEETDPESISHFCIGQSQINNIKLSIFRYSCPTPFLASASTGLYKRMRWNVEREIEVERCPSEEFYFLCFEDVLEEADDNTEENNGGQTATERKSMMMRIWSIGQWIQTYPDSDDINDWVLCPVPCGQYKQLLYLGNEEPPSCTATDFLLGVLLSEELDVACATET